MLSDARKVGWKRQFLTAGDSEVGKTDGLKGPKRRRRLTSHTGDNARRRSAVRDAFPASRKLHDRNRVALVPCLLSPHHPPPHRHSPVITSLEITSFSTLSLAPTVPIKVSFSNTSLPELFRTHTNSNKPTTSYEQKRKNASKIVA
jgi:hypothetical protein